MPKTMSTDLFISQLYREAPQVPLADFSVWALDLLQQVISFDGAIWGTGNIESRKFHTQASVDVPLEIFDTLLAYSDINPLVESLIATNDTAINMQDVVNDEQFYQSTLYQECFKPFSIERILSAVHANERAGIFTLLTLYRYDREHVFTEQEKAIQSQLLFHLLSAASHRQIIALTEPSIVPTTMQSAICDAQGHYHAVQTSFLDMLEDHLQGPIGYKFPLDIINDSGEYLYGDLLFSQQQLGELYRINVRLKSPLDDLSLREKQVVDGICQGNTFKQIARTLTLSPSTVSNHLYRIYMKLGINTRSELIELVSQQSDTLI